MARKTVYVVPHTHWDHEWYFSEDDSASLLYEAVDEALTVLAKNETYRFTFDGQTSVIDDYLKLRPEQRERLTKAIQRKQLFVGPWYTQTDTLMVDTESIIRNLLIGTREAGRMGHCLQIGYLPDIFGQHAYLPAIFNGFGLKYSIFQRGVRTDQISEDLNFVWSAPNGDSVRANNLFFGYGPGKYLTAEKAYVTTSLLPLVKSLEAKNRHSDRLLLPAGGDQIFIRRTLPSIIDQLNRFQQDYRFVLADYERFMNDTWENDGARLNNRICGELIAGQKSRIHQSVRSQRIDVKMAAAEVEEKIYYQLEPLAVLAHHFGRYYPQAQIEAMLKRLLESEAHDSISGCNSDETNRTILERLRKAERMADDQINILEKQLARGIVAPNTGNVVVFNLLPKAIVKVLRFVLFTRDPQIALASEDGRTLPQTLIEQSYLSGGKQVEMTAQGEKEVELPGYYRSEILAEVALHGFGYSRYCIQKNQQAEKLRPSRSQSIENQYYRILVEDGQVKIINRQNRQKRTFFYFEDQPDAGDSYDFSPLKHNQPVHFSTAARVIRSGISELYQTMTVVHRIRVAPDLEGSRSADFDRWLMITTTIGLTHRSDVIHLEHRLVNAIKDHRVRVVFPNDNNGSSYADEGYCTIRRKNKDEALTDWKDKHYAEAPVSIYPFEHFVFTTDGSSSTGVIAHDLKEYQSTDQQLILTLFRSVGVLGKDNLAWRPGRASGINNKRVETPDAQMQGRLTFRYAYRWDDTANESRWFAATEHVQARQRSYQLQSLNTYEQRLERFELPQPDALNHLPAHINLLTLQENLYIAALKKLADRDGVLIRVFNPGVETALQRDVDVVRRLKLAEIAEPEAKRSIAAKDVATFEIRLREEG
jgi:alpha-mannosidase